MIQNGKYGDLYKLNISYNKKSLNSIKLDDSLVIMDSRNCAYLRKYGAPVSIYDFYRQYILELFTKMIFAISEDSIRDMNEVLQNIIDKKIYMGIETLQIFMIENAKLLKGLKSTSDRKKLLKGTLICNPNLTEYEFLVYLGLKETQHLWKKIDVNITHSSLKTNIMDLIHLTAVNQLSSMRNGDIISLPLQTVIDKGVQLDIIDI